MSALALLLIAKIAVTLLVVVLPLLFLPKPVLDGWLGTNEIATYRLYGVALLALLTGYGLALQGHFEGRAVGWIAPIGLVSNLGAALVLFSTNLAGWRGAAAAFFAIIALIFASVLLWPTAMTQPLWAQ